MLNKSFLKKVSGFISSKNLLDKSKKYIVALSGGADSVALSLTLRQSGYDVEAAHCNFHLRGEESDRDERFCVEFCNKNGIPLHVTHFDTVGFADLRKISIEMAARHLRYNYFRQLKTDVGAAAICVAHHRDDSVETVIMNLIRGTGIHGLTGIKPVNGDIVRPLLCVSRSEIEKALAEAGQDFVTDSTNLVDDVVRNKIRLDILPLMREINPSVGESIAKTAERVAEAANVIDRMADGAVERVAETRHDGTVRIYIDRLMTELSPEIVLFRLLKQYSFNSFQTDSIYQTLTAEPGRVFYSSTHRLLVDRDCLVIEPLGVCRSKPLVMPCDGLYVYDDMTRFRVEIVERTEGFVISKDRNCCLADCSAVRFPLTIRAVEAGDRFVPFGMKGSKLVNDYLTDRKFNLFDKRRQLIVTDADGKAVWLVNQRPDNRCRVTAATGRILRITCEKI